MGVRQPAVQGPHRGLHGEADSDGGHGQELGGAGQFAAVVRGECHHVECARRHTDEEESEQHDDGAEERVEDELPGGGLPLSTAPAGDEEVHRDEDHLEGEEEEQQVEYGEGREGAGLQDQEQGDEGLRGGSFGELEVAVERAEEEQQRGHQEEGERDAVDAEVDPDVQRLDPADVRRRLEAGRGVVVEAQGEGDGRGEDHSGHGDAVAEHGLFGALALEAGRGGQERRGGAEERCGHDERQKELHHGRADINHG